MQHKEVYQYLKQYFEVALSHLSCRVREEAFYYTERESLHVRLGARLSSNLFGAPIIYRVAGQFENDLESLPEFGRLCEYVIKNGLEKDITGGLPVVTGVFLYLFVPTLCRYFSDVRSLDFHVRDFDRVYQGIDDYLNSEVVSLLYIAPLTGCTRKAGSKSFGLAQNVAMRQLTISERQMLLEDAEWSPCWSRDEVLQSTHALEVKVNFRKQEGFPSSGFPEADFIYLQALLRLATRERISIRCVYKSSSPWYLGPRTSTVTPYMPWPVTSLGMSGAMPPGYFAAPKFIVELAAQDLKELRKLWKNFLEMKNTPGLCLALRRFSFLYDKLTYEDQLIDAWVGLEALFSRWLSRLKLGLSRRIACFLAGGDNQYYEELKKEVSDCYDRRSDIAHGRLPEADPIGVVSLTRGYLAHSLRRLLQQRAFSLQEIDNRADKRERPLDAKRKRRER